MAFEPHTYDYGPSGRKNGPLVRQPIITDADRIENERLAAEGGLVANPILRPDAPRGNGPEVVYQGGAKAPVAVAPPSGSYFDPIGVPNDVMAERAIRDGWGSGVPREAAMTQDAMARRQQRIAEGERRASVAKAQAVAKSIARTDPQSWQARVEKFNRGVGSQGGLAISLEDVLGHARRPGSVMVPDKVGGIYGTAPDIVGQQPMSRRREIQTPNGSYREQLIGGRAFGVPMVRVGDGSVPDGNMKAEEFDRAYTQEDAAVTARALYKAGFNEFATRQRRIDAGRAALLDDTLTGEQRARAEVELNGMENRLHQEFIRSLGRRVTMDGDTAAMMSMDEPKKPQAVGPRGRFNVSSFLSGVDRTVESTIKDADVGDGLLKTNKYRTKPEDAHAVGPDADKRNAKIRVENQRADAAVRALRRESFLRALERESRGADLTAMRDSFDAEAQAIAQRYSGDDAESPAALRDFTNAVYAHLPIFYDALAADAQQGDDAIETSIDRLAAHVRQQALGGNER